jgi:hypothetical protein
MLVLSSAGLGRLASRAERSAAHRRLLARYRHLILQLEIASHFRDSQNFE